MSDDSVSFAGNDAIPAGERAGENFTPVFALMPGPRRIDKRVRERIQREREQGVSYWRIAKRLNSEQVPTARGGKRWRQGVVHQALQVAGLSETPRTNAVNAPLRRR